MNFLAWVSPVSYIVPRMNADCNLWQSIETAPKNGTEILVWREDAGTLLARWIAPIDFLTDREAEESKMTMNELEEADWFYADFIAGGRLGDPPTQWMPVPSPVNTLLADPQDSAQRPVLGD